MSIRDILLTILTAFGLASLIVIVAAADSLSLWLIVALAIVVWIAYIIVVIRDHQRDIRYPIIRYRPAEFTGPPTRVRKTPQTTVYDQKEEK